MSKRTENVVKMKNLYATSFSVGRFANGIRYAVGFEDGRLTNGIRYTVGFGFGVRRSANGIR